MSYSDGEIVERGGHRFRINYPADTDHEAPWEDGDGRAIVDADPTPRDRPKHPGERVLWKGRQHDRVLFDWAGSIAKAKAEGWGMGDEKLATWQRKELKLPTRGQIAEAAVQSEFDSFRAWLREEWWYVGVVVTHLKEEPHPMVDAAAPNDYDHALWGIESSDDEFLTATVNEFIEIHLEEIAEEEKDAKRAAEEQERRDTEARNALLKLYTCLRADFEGLKMRNTLHALEVLADRAGIEYPPK